MRTRPPATWAALGLAVTLAACGARQGAPTSDAGRRRAEPGAQAAVQLSDLPTGFRLCGYSGDVESFTRRVRELSPSYAESMAGMWARLKDAGAAAAFAAFYGDSQRACTRLIVPARPEDFDSEAQHSAAHPRMVSSVVVQFTDAEAAERAFRSDALGQSRLEDHVAMEVSRGEATRLGPNSLVAVTQGAVVQVREAAWQKRAFAILFRSAGVGRTESETLTAAMNLRIR